MVAPESRIKLLSRPGLTFLGILAETEKFDRTEKTPCIVVLSTILALCVLDTSSEGDVHSGKLAFLCALLNLANQLESFHFSANESSIFESGIQPFGQSVSMI